MENIDIAVVLFLVVIALLVIALLRRALWGLGSTAPATRKGASKRGQIEKDLLLEAIHRQDDREGNPLFPDRKK